MKLNHRTSGTVLRASQFFQFEGSRLLCDLVSLNGLQKSCWLFISAFYLLGQNGHFPQGRNEAGRGAPLFLLNIVLGNLTIAREKEEMGANRTKAQE